MTSGATAPNAAYRNELALAHQASGGDSGLGHANEITRLNAEF